MSVNNESQVDRLLDLLADQALFGLTDSELQEVEALREQFPTVRPDEFELTAAAIQCSHIVDETNGDFTMPATIRSKIVDTASNPGMFEFSEQTPPLANDPIKTTADRNNHEAVSPTPIAKVQPARREYTREVIAWMVAAAAMLIALFALFDRRQDDSSSQMATVTLDQKKQSLLDAEEDTHNVKWIVNDSNWNADPDVAIVGELTWSDRAQRGFMSFQGLAANANTDQVYQLWMFDKTRDDKYPVNGGVFQIENPDAETIIPIDAELVVTESYQFAITVEDAPGVVVSDRKRLPLLAVVDSAN